MQVNNNLTTCMYFFHHNPGQYKTLQTSQSNICIPHCPQSNVCLCHLCFFIYSSGSLVFLIGFLNADCCRKSFVVLNSEQGFIRPFGLNLYPKLPLSVCSLRAFRVDFVPSAVDPVWSVDDHTCVPFQR